MFSAEGIVPLYPATLTGLLFFCSVYTLQHLQRVTGKMVVIDAVYSESGRCLHRWHAECVEFSVCICSLLQCFDILTFAFISVAPSMYVKFMWLFETVYKCERNESLENTIQILILSSI